MSPTIAVLALQGAFIEHEQRLQSLGLSLIHIFAGLENCEGMNEFGISAANRSASSMAPFMPLAPSVSTSSAP